MNRAVTLLERERETDRIASLLRATHNGTGSALFVTGAPGIGKTELLRRAHELAAEEGFLILSARASEMEQNFDHGVVRQLFEPLVTAASPEKQASWFSGAAALARPLLTGDDDQSNRVRSAPAADPAFPLLHGLFWLCDNIARHRPSIISVDDIQWADQASMRFLVYLARRLEGLPIMLILAARASPESTELRAQLQRELEIETLVLEPLSPVSTAAMVGHALGEGSDTFLEACHSSTGGNPFLVKELISALRTAGVSPAGAQASVVSQMGPPDVARSILLRIKNASVDALRLARAVALLGDRADLRRAAEFCGLVWNKPVWRPTL